MSFETLSDKRYSVYCYCEALQTVYFRVVLNGHSLRVAIFVYLWASYDRNDNEYFKVVLPESNTMSAIHTANLETLRNLRDCMMRIEMATTNLTINLNEENLTIECFYTGYNHEQVLDTIYSENHLITVKEGNMVGFDKIAVSHGSAPASTDTIDYGTGGYQIELDVYTDHAIFSGENDETIHLGNYLTTLSKSYFGKALWFDLSTLLSKKVSYSSAFLSELELDATDTGFKLWSNADTMTDYRFIAKRTDGKINQPFYYSSPLYVVNGYDYTLNPMELAKNEDGSSYVFDSSQNFKTNIFTRVKPLTTLFNRTHIKGQKQYFNYIHKYKGATLEVSSNDNQFVIIGLHYKFYTQSGTFIKKYTSEGQKASDFNKVNTTLLQLDQFLPAIDNKAVGRIDVYLCRWSKSQYPSIDEPEVIISKPMSFRILPEVLNEVNDFAFLNRLGGWDTMNFGGNFSSEFKTAGSTIYRTLQPGFNLQSEIEKVVIKTAEEKKTVQTAPITMETVEWLREISVSPAVFELSTKRYVIIDDMSLRYNSTDDLYQVEMKYHYTDTFNTQIR